MSERMNGGLAFIESRKKSLSKIKQPQILRVYFVKVSLSFASSLWVSIIL